MKNITLEDIQKMCVNKSCQTCPLYIWNIKTVTGGICTFQTEPWQWNLDVITEKMNELKRN